jgi:membrane-associated protease RseP (regulator of RpoE activity)
LHPSHDDSGRLAPPAWAQPPRRKFQDRLWRHVLLLVLTILTTTVAGVLHYVSYTAGFDPTPGTLAAVDVFSPRMLLTGFWYSGTILSILGLHEFGHYAACRYYDVDASLPFFIPAPLILTGTLGAFIRIREPIPTKRMLFDIGIAGPIAGFALAVPALVMGLAMSTVVRVPPDFSGFSLGEPLLFKATAAVIWGPVPDGYSINMHPMAFAAWFGLLATALNLFPIGQLDGGHISYAVLGRRSSHVTVAMVVAAVALTYFSSSWLVWTVLMVLMLAFFGRHHPRTVDEDVPLDPLRVRLAIFALVIFVVCFTPAPIEPWEIIGR